MQPRTMVVKILGLLNLLFGVMDLVALPAERIARNSPMFRDLLGPPPPPAWQAISLIGNGVAALVLIISGVGLLQFRPWARKLSLSYAALAALLAVCECGVGLNGGGSLVSGLGGLFVALIYPGVLVFFMTKRSVVDALNKQAPAE